MAQRANRRAASDPVSEGAAPDPTASPDAQPKRRRVRIAPEKRHREFVLKAVELFAEVGFDAGTRELAQRLNVTQPLLYRYFPSKDDLILAVYKEIYLDRWKPSWPRMLNDHSRPLAERLQAFYEDYTDTIFTREWIRIYLFAGLRGVDINRRYIVGVETSILEPIARSLRRELGLDENTSIHPEEIELFWTLHGGIFYYGVRKFIYGFDCPIGKSQMIANALKVFLEGAPAVIKEMTEFPAKSVPERRPAVTAQSSRRPL